LSLRSRAATTVTRPRVSSTRQTESVNALQSLPYLGVGVMYNPALPEFLNTDLDAIDFLEITSDMFWTDQGRGREPRFEELESWVEVLESVKARRPVIANNIGL